MPLNGLAIEEINLEVISRLKIQAGPHCDVVDRVLTEVATAIRGDDEDLQVYTSGGHEHFQVSGIKRWRKCQ